MNCSSEREGRKVSARFDLTRIEGARRGNS
jgi:hypothetical protein